MLADSEAVVALSSSVNTGLDSTAVKVRVGDASEDVTMLETGDDSISLVCSDCEAVRVAEGVSMGSELEVQLEMVSEAIVQIEVYDAVPDGKEEEEGEVRELPLETYAVDWGVELEDIVGVPDTTSVSIGCSSTAENSEAAAVADQVGSSSVEVDCQAESVSTELVHRVKVIDGSVDEVSSAVSFFVGILAEG